MSRPTTPFSVPVIISTIQRNPSTKYIVVEGVDDIVVYRCLISSNLGKNISVLSAGGRDKVLEVFTNLKNTPGINNSIFIIDQDSWIFSGIPKDFQHPRIIYTSGYSIENDIYIDKQLEALMQGTGVYSSFKDCLATYLKWFALAITRFCTNANADSEKLKVHPDNFFQSQTTIDTLCALKEGEVFPQELYDDLLLNYALKFRGKCLLPLAVQSLGKRDKGAKYNTNTIMEEAAITGRGVYLNRIFSEVERLAS